MPRNRVPTQQNFLTQSNSFTGTAWTRRGSLVLTPNAIANPVDGTVDAWLFEGMTQTGSSDIYRNVAQSISAPYCLSLWFKRKSTSGIFTVQNPEGPSRGKMSVNLATCGDNWFQIYPGAAGVTLDQPFVSVTGSGIVQFYSQSGGPIDFYAYNAQANSGSLPCGNTVTGATAVNTGNPRNRIPTVQNLYKYSNTLNTKTPNDVTFTLDSTVLNPFGVMSSLKMQEFVDASPQQHFVADSTAYPDIQPGDKFNASVFIRPNTRSKVMFAPFNAAGQYHAYYFDLINKTSVLFTGTSLASNPLVEDYPNGFKRISLDCIAPSDLSTFYPRNYIWEALSMSNPASDVVYQADGTGIINLMGFQVSKGWGPKPYVETGATAINTGNLRNRISSATPRTRINSLANYALNSENGVTGHTKFSIQDVTNAATIAPDGTLTAYKITEDSSNGRHFNFQSIGSVPIPSQICCSAYLKAGERRYANIRVDIDASIYIGVTFDLLTGVVTSTTQSVVKPQFGYGISPAANGFFRCWVTDLNVASTNVNLVIGPSNSATPTYTTAVPDYQGDGVSGIYAWGEQLNRGSVPADYIKTTSAAITAGTTAPRGRV